MTDQIDTVQRTREFNEGFVAGVAAARARTKTLAALQIPVAYVGAPQVLESVADVGQHMTILTRENRSYCGVALYADPVAATQGNNTLSESAWKVANSLQCTAAWLENGCSVAEAVTELRLNERMLRSGRVLA